MDASDDEMGASGDEMDADETTGDEENENG